MAKRPLCRHTKRGTISSAISKAIGSVGPRSNCGLLGIADITDNARIVRFKITVKAGKATLVQRQVIGRIMAEFGPAGVEFA
jgi:hypothetical protein